MVNVKLDLSRKVQSKNTQRCFRLEEEPVFCSTLRLQFFRLKRRISFVIIAVVDAFHIIFSAVNLIGQGIFQQIYFVVLHSRFLVSIICNNESALHFISSESLAFTASANTLNSAKSLLLHSARAGLSTGSEYLNAS